MTDKPASASWFHDLVERDGPPPPAAQMLGFRLVSVDAEAGTMQGTFVGRPEFANMLGGIQGGFLAAMLDTTLSFALLGTLPPGHVAPTLQLDVQYLQIARVGPLTGRGRVVRRGATIAFLAGELLDPDGEIVTTATATARIVRPK